MWRQGPHGEGLPKGNNLELLQGSLHQDFRLHLGLSLGVEKIISNLGSTHTKDCGNLDRVLRLNAVSSVPLSKDSLTIILNSILVPKESFVALLDCGSSDCFIETQFVHKHSLPMTTIPPIPGKLFDGTTNSTITQTVELPIRFPTGELQTVTFYITSLDASCSIVLGHNWLTRYNPTIDWVLGSITFKTTEPALPTATTMATAQSTSLPTFSSPPEPTSKPPKLMAPHISLVNAAAFVHACKLEGSKAYQLNLASMDKLARGTSTSLPELTDSIKQHVPEVYHDFTDVFSKTRANTLAPHRPYDLKINLDEGTSPPLGPIYSLSVSELQSL